MGYRERQAAIWPGLWTLWNLHRPTGSVGSGTKAFSDKEPVHNQPKTEQNIEDLEEPAAVYDFTGIIQQAHVELLSNPGALAYLESRGISPGLIEKYKIGYDNLGYNHLLQAYPQMQSKGRNSICINMFSHILTQMGGAIIFLLKL